MRLELALIVGILFFCSWCAYIVARMNSSVNVTPPAPSTTTTSSSSPLSSSSVALGGGADLSPSGGEGRQMGQQAPLNGSSSSTVLIGHASRAPLASYRQWPPYASSGGAQHLQPQDGGAIVNYAPASEYHAHSGTQQQQQQQPQWRAYALPTAAAGYAAHSVSAPLLDYAGQPATLAEQTAAVAAAAAESDIPAADGEPEDENEEGVADGSDDQPQAATDEYPSAPPEESEEAEASEDPNDYQDPQLLPPPPQTELEEVANRRSFDELQSDSSERDKHGRLVATRRRHLINGCPVTPPKRHAGANRKSGSGRARSIAASHEAAGRQQEEPEAEEQDDDQDAEVSGSEPRESTGSERDFERLVDEIDQEDRLRKKAAGAVPGSQPTAREASIVEAAPSALLERRSDDADTPPEKSHTPSLVRNSASKMILQEVRRNATAGRRQPLLPPLAPHPNKDSHEHSLQESLSAQQWDDDSATSGASGSAAAAAAAVASGAPELAEDEDQEEVSNIVARDAEARRLERMSRELLLSPARVSRELDGESARRRRRRKRHAVDMARDNLGMSNSSAVATSSSELSSSGGGGDGKIALGPDARQTGEEAASRRAAAPAKAEAQQVLPANSTSRGETAPRAAAAAAVAAVADYNYAAPATTATLAAPATNEGAAARVESLMANSSQSSGAIDHEAPLAALQPLSGQEDMHVEVLADPPAAGGALAGSNPHTWPPASYGPLHTPTIGAGPLGGHANRVGAQLAAGSHKVAAKKKKKKKMKSSEKKKKYKKAHKSRMVDSKYKAARAYAHKHAQRAKKGHSHKKRRKSEKELEAHRKHFKGSTRGNKFAHGGGARGLRKGAHYHKDKGYKKRGFKKAYHKLETGDHKTYFDEFRDKDHHKKWKNFDDKHKYSQKKRWSGSDAKHLQGHRLKLAKARAHKAGQWRESAAHRHSKEMDKVRKFKKSTSQAKAVKSAVKRKKKKKKKKMEKKMKE